MPYNPGTGIYTLPAIYLAIPGTTIIAAQHNDPLEDLEVANNYARPIVAGGTGQNSAVLARGSTALATEGNIGSKGANIASAAALTLLDNFNYFHVTGAVTITSITTRPAGQRILLEFEGAPVLTHNAATLILIGAANITIVAGTVMEFVSEGSGNWRQAESSSRISFGGAGTAAAPNLVINSAADTSSGLYWDTTGGDGPAMSVASTLVTKWQSAGFMIGTTDLIDVTIPPSHGVSASASSGLLVAVRTGGTALQVMNIAGAGQTVAGFYQSTNLRATIDTDGDYNNLSDKRLKQKWKTFDSGALIDGIEAWKFQWKDSGRSDYGVLAQDVAEVMPEAAKYDAEDDRWFVAYDKFIPVLLAEMKALRKRVAELEAR